MVNKSDKVYAMHLRQILSNLMCARSRGQTGLYKIVEAKVDDEKELTCCFAIMRCDVELLKPWSFGNNPITFKSIPGLTLSIREKLKPFNDCVCKMYEGTLFGSPSVPKSHSLLVRHHLQQPASLKSSDILLHTID